MSRDDRGQMVLLAAVAIAVALVPMLLAYLQLGYHPDVADPRSDHALGVEHTLERELATNSIGIPSSYDWSDRAAAVTEVRRRLVSTLAVLNRSEVARSTVIQVSYNRSVASHWAGTNCPSGPARQFGPCEAIGGVVVQERAGETHVLAIGVDVQIRSANSLVRLHRVVERS